ncbi:MAG: DUF4234 domain-containing protein [Clostridia bacterium]|nr:DUF4234 domain-containing protein [Clostridia bacterium]
MTPWYDEEEKKAYQPPLLATNRSMWKLMLFNVLTLGIYSIVFFIPFSFDLDRVAPKPDRSKTMNFLFAYILSIFTFSIVMTVWHYHIAERVEEALAERQIDYDFGTNDFWCWGILGGLVIVGTFVYFHKLCRAMNLLCESYNQNPTAPSATEH